MLVLLLLASQVLAKDGSRANYEIKRVDTCPEVGYYFRRDLAPNSLTPGPCFLCFCQNDGTAICWKRENKRCDVESYHRHHVGRRETRVRRSPFGLSDIFFRDAAREVFNKQSPEECKPFESSFSKDCPPADWCVGCTVCDCDANGRWDCHLLSFCPDKKGTKTVKTRKDAQQKALVKHRKKSKPVSLPIKKVVPKPKRNIVKPAAKKPHVNKKLVHKKPPATKKPVVKKLPARSKPVDKKTTVNNKPINKRQAKLINAKQTIRKVIPIQPKNLLKKKQEAIQQAIKQTNKDNVNIDNEEIVKSVFKQVMASVNKMVSEKLETNKEALKNFTKAYERSIAQNNMIAQKNLKNKQKSRQRKIVHNKTTRRPQRRYGRKKREVPTTSPRYIYQISLTSDPLKQENVTDTPSNNMVETTTNFIGSNTYTTINSLNLTTVMANTTLTDSEYYKYSMDNSLNSPTTTQKTEFDKVYNKAELIRSVSHDNIKTTTNANNNKIMKDEELISLIDKMLSPENNIRKWNYVKMYRDKGKHLKKEIFLTKNLDHYHNSKIENDVLKPKVSRKDIERRIGHKYNVKKILNTTHSVSDEDKNLNYFKMPNARYKLNDLQTILKQLLREMNSKNKTVRPNTKPKTNVFKIMKRLIKKIFSKNNTTDTTLKQFRNSGNLNKKHIIEIICENMGPCKIQPSHKPWLKTKVKELNYETRNILRIIKTIKGLLHLVDIPKKYNEEVIKENSTFHDDVHKLNIILKSNKIEDYNMSNTNIIQIGYIKKHAQDFIKSFGKFATILNEMIAVLTVNNNYRKIGMREKTDANMTQNQYLPNLKSLFLRYNLIQNTFMRKMYKMLIGMENNSTNYNNDVSNKVSNDRDLNETVTIDDISRRFIQNLRKLKALAQIMNSNRRKRDANNEDTMEYMLLMMEYLLKQNHPTEPAPVHDGIDLLLETIKGAPDIKQIQKKVLKNTSPTMPLIHTMKPNSLVMGDENMSDPYKISKEEKLTSSADDSKQNAIEQNIENEYLDLVVGRKAAEINLNLANNESTNKSIENILVDNKQKVIESITEVINEINNKEYVIENVNNVTEASVHSVDGKFKALAEDNSNTDKMETGIAFQNDRRILTDEDLNIVDKPDVHHSDKDGENVDTNPNINTTPEIYLDERKNGEDIDENLIQNDNDNKKNEEQGEDNFSVDKIEKPNTDLDDRKYEVFTADNADDFMPKDTKVKQVTELNPSKVEKTTVGAKVDVKAKHLAIDIEINTNGVTSGYKKTKLDWIEEAYDKEMKKYNEMKNSTATTKAPTSKPAKFKKQEDNVSDISKEVLSGYRRKTSKINAEEVMFKKQMELLNSLDYGTEKSDFDDPDSKDGPDSGDAFSTYFV